jgi:hypothetical protein
MTPLTSIRQTKLSQQLAQPQPTQPSYKSQSRDAFPSNLSQLSLQVAVILQMPSKMYRVKSLKVKAKEKLNSLVLKKFLVFQM